MTKDLEDQLAAELPKLRGYALAVARDPHRADDLTQDTLVRALERSDSYRGDAPLGAWLRRILHNLAVDQSRRLQESPRDDVADVADACWRDDSWTVDASIILERAETADNLRDALLQLPFIYRSAVVLHDMEGLTVALIASIQSISLAAAKQRLRRGRMMLLTVLAQSEPPQPTDVPLRCWDARSRISDYLDDELAARQRGQLEAHLGACSTCPPIYSSLVGVVGAVGALSDEAAIGPAQLQYVQQALRRRGGEIERPDRK